ncbi:FAD-dependent oxidoreductase [Streptomyces lasalocidi]
MTRTRTAIVVGGGIAGSVAALALRRAGIEATVHESHTGTADGIGGGLGVAPNGRAALGLVGLDRIGAPMNAIVLQNHKGRVITEIRQPMQFSWRTDLYRRLYDLAREHDVQVHHGHRLVDVRESGTGIRAVFADGTTSEEADILIGADGLRSTVRRADRCGGSPTALLGTPRLRRPRRRRRTAAHRRPHVHGLRQAGLLRLPDLRRRHRRLVRQPATPLPDVEGGRADIERGVAAPSWARPSPRTASPPWTCCGAPGPSN